MPRKPKDANIANIWFDLDVPTQRDTQEWIARHNNPKFSQIVRAALRLLIHLPDELTPIFVGLPPEHPTYVAAMRIIAWGARQAVILGVDAVTGVTASELAARVIDQASSEAGGPKQAKTDRRKASEGG